MQCFGFHVNLFYAKLYICVIAQERVVILLFENLNQSHL